MGSLCKQRLWLSEKYKAITEVESATKPLKVHKVLLSPLIKITERAAKNLDLIKKLHNQSYLQTLNCFKTTVSLRRRTGTISLAKSSRQSFLKKRKLYNKKQQQTKKDTFFTP